MAAYTKLTLATCQLSKLPTLKDGENMLRGPPGPEDRYEPPSDLLVDDVDAAADVGDEDGNPEVAATWKKGITPCVLDCGL